MDLASVAVTADVGRRPSGDTNVYVVGSERALLIDPAGRTDRLDDLVAERDVAHVALTHHHPDHTGAVAEYAAECAATVWARTGRAGDFEAATGVRPDRTFGDGTAIPAGDEHVTVVDAPGHAPEHVAFAQGEALVTGDLAVEPGTVVVGHPQGDMRAYVSSLRRLHARDPAVLYPGHGDPIDEPRTTLKRLIDHRLDREARVLAAVRDGRKTVAAITDAAYEKDVSQVRDLAEATVRAHLQKLACEGRIDWADDRALPAGTAQ